MFKKTLVAVAALGAFGSAMAANVTLYGIADLGLGYSHVKADGKTHSTDSWEMQSGANSASRFGLKGSEELGNGVSVGFVLENGFSADTGALSDKQSRLFDRESQVYIKSDFGTLSFGRVGELASGNGTFGMFGGNVSPFSTGWTHAYGHKYVIGGDYGRLDNTVTYRTPTLAGLTATVQYSMNGNSLTNKDGVENTKTADRQAAAGLNYKVGGLDMNLIYTYKDKAGFGASEPVEGQSVLFGAAYDCGAATTYFDAGYWDHMTFQKGGNALANDNWGKTEGWGVNAGVMVPVDAFKVKFNAGYADAEVKDTENADITRWTVAAGTEYTLSKRTYLYAGAGYMWTRVEGNAKATSQTYGVDAGLVHKF